MLTILLLNSMVSLVILIKNYRQNKVEGIFMFITTLCLPVVGIMVWLILYIQAYISLYKAIETDHKIQSNSEQLLHERNSNYTFIGSDNPLFPNEIFLLADQHSRKNIIIQAIKDDAAMHMDLLQLALRDPDTEISHYAAAAITEVKRKYTQRLKEVYEALGENLGDTSTIKDYIDLVEKCTEEKILDSKIIQKHIHHLSELLAVALDEGSRDKLLFIKKIEYDIYLKNWDVVLDYCHLFLSSHPKSIRPYIMYLKYFYALKDYYGFHEVLNVIRQHPAASNEHGQELVRFWTTKGEYADNALYIQSIGKQNRS